MRKTLLLQDDGADLLSRKEKILYSILFFFFAALYMPGITWLYNVAMYLFFVYSFFFNTIPQKWALLKQRKEIFLMLLFFLLNIASTFLSNNIKSGVEQVGIRLSLFVVPVAIGSIYIRDIVKERLLLAYGVATAAAACGCLLWGVYRAVKFHDASLLYNDNLSDVVNLQSIYFAMMINLAVFGFIYLLNKKAVIISTGAVVVLLLILFIVHFLLASRIAIIILYGAAVVFAVEHIVVKRKYLEGATLLMGLLVGSFLLFTFFPKTINRFKELTYTKFEFKNMGKESHFNTAVTAGQWNGANIRIAVWECAWGVVKNNMVCGTGLGDKQDDLQNAYKEKGFLFGYNSHRNTHNSYLDVWMSMGLIGLAIFITGFFLLPFYNCCKSKDGYGIMVLVCFTLSLIGETYIDRTMGNTLLAFFIAFIVSYKKPG